MKNKKIISLIIGFAVFAVGLIGAILTRSAAIAEDAASDSKMWFALSLIALVVGLVSAIAIALPQRKTADVRTLAYASMFAALCYVGFAYLKIDIPVGTERTAFHLGNTFVVLAALFIGGFWGGMAGAVGLTIADLTTGYVTSAPKTFILKLCIGLISGLVAHKIFHLNQNKERKIPLPVATVLACAAGMVFNIVADPVVGYFYKQYLLGVPQDAAKLWAKIGALTTFVNAVVAVIVASVLYLALRTALKRSGTLQEL